MKDVVLKILELLNNHFKFIVIVVLLFCAGFFAYITNDQIYKLLVAALPKFVW